METHIIYNLRCKNRSIYVNVFTFLDFMWSLGALPDGKLIHIIFSTVTSYLLYPASVRPFLTLSQSTYKLVYDIRKRTIEVLIGGTCQNG